MQAALVIDEAHNFFIRVLRDAALRGPLGWHRGHRRLPVHRPDRGRTRQAAASRACLQNISHLSPARLRGRPRRRRAGDGSLQRQHHSATSRTSAGSGSTRWTSCKRAELPRREPVARGRRAPARVHREHAADGGARRHPRGAAGTRAPRSEQQRRGDHPHDHGRYIQPPLVWSVHTPVIARFRTIHIDLAAWPGRSTDRAGAACRRAPEIP